MANDELKKAYARLAAYIYKYCQKLGCTYRRKKCTGLCCHAEVCDDVEQQLRNQGISVVRPGKTFVKNGRCILPAYQRPLCAVHACDRLQMFAGARFMRHYLDLRDNVNSLEKQRHDRRKS